MNSLLRKILSPRRLEYLVIDIRYNVLEFSTGVKRFAEKESVLNVGEDARWAFTELIGLEGVLNSLILQDLPNFQIKGIQRHNLYYDLLIIAEEEAGHTTLTLIIEDVSERMQLEQTLVQRTNEILLLMDSLKKSEQYLHQIIDVIADIIIVTTAEGNIKTTNQAVQNLFGYTGIELYDQPLSTLFLDSDRLIQLFQGELETEGVTRSGETIPISFSCAQIPIDPTSHQIVFSGRDITQRKKAEAQLELARSLAIAASESKSLFLATMSHEIRTPMNAVLGMTELLLHTPLNPEQQELVENISLGGDTLLNLINDILDLSKMEAEEMSLESCAFDLATTIEEVTTILASQAHRKGIDLVAWIDHRIQTDFLGDRHRLKQVLTNLVGNAIKFTHQGEVVVKLEILDQNPLGETLLISVKDTGIGIAPDQHSRLFQPFSQGEASTTRHYGGTGLGLTISQQLVNLMGGEIGFTSAEGQGTTFWVRLFLPYAPTPPLSTPIPALTKQPFLLINNSPATRGAMTELFLGLGIPLLLAENTDRAQEILSHSPVAGILIDATLAHTWLVAPLAVPIILLIKTEEVDIPRGLLHGVSEHFLVKPVRRERLRNLLSNLLTEVAPSAPLEIAPVSPRSLRILLAEDNPTNQLVALKLLERLGYSADLARHGEEVLEKWQNGSYDVIFMDCQMPRLDGYEATQKIRQQETDNEHVTIIAMTANAMKEDRQRCLEVGMDDYLSKPLSLQKLEEVLTMVGRKLG